MTAPWINQRKTRFPLVFRSVCTTFVPMKRLLTIILAIFGMLTISAESQQESNKRVRYKDGPAYIYRISLADKQGTGFSLEHPTRFLSRRSVDRRRRQGLSLDSTDLPVSYRYRRLIESRDICVIGQSRWQNTLLVRVKDTTLMTAFLRRPSRPSIMSILKNATASAATSMDKPPNKSPPSRANDFTISACEENT